MRYFFLVIGVALVLGSGCATDSAKERFEGPFGFAVEASKVRDGALNNAADTLIYYPSADGVTVDPEAMPAPVIFFAPGLTLDQRFYYSYGRLLASWGYVVHMARYRGLDNNASAADISTHLDLLLARHGDEGDLFFEALDPERIGVSGHSMGAKYSLMVCMDDARFKAAVAMEPVDGAAAFLPPSENLPGISPERMEEVEEPVLFVGGEWNSLFSPKGENFEAMYRQSSMPAQLVTVNEADHASFHDYQLGVWVEILHLIMGAHNTNDEQAKDLAMQYMVSWFKVYLEGEEDFEQYLTGTVAQSDVDTGLVAIETRGRPSL